jgi:hypothetical protein
MTDVFDAVTALRPAAEWTLRGDGLADLEWHDTRQTPPTQGELDDWLAGKPQRQLIAYAQSRRAATVNAGCVVMVGGANIPIWADNAAQAAITGAVQAAQALGSAFGTSWKGRDGQFYPLDNSGVFTLAMGAMTFVSTAFAVEAAARQAIMGGAITTSDQIDALPWPSTTAPQTVAILPTSQTADNLVGAVAQLQQTVTAVVRALQALGQSPT